MMVFHNVVRVEQRYVPTEAVAKNKASAVELIQQIRAMTNVTPAHHRQVLSIALWKWTEAGGVSPHPKYNIRYVSSGVLEAIEPVAINHEHVHTRKTMVAKLLTRGLSNRAAREYLEARGEACVVTVAEHAQLGASNKSGWARYVDADIGVFDRQLQHYVDPQLIGGGTEVTPLAPVPAPQRHAQGENEVERDIAAYASQSLQPLLLRLARTANLATAVVAPQTTVNKPSYYRIHDALLEEPTRAVAYANFNGNVDLALDLDDVPDVWRPRVVERHVSRKPYRVRWKVTNEESLEVAENLVLLALERVRIEAQP
jgi:hypothetical protein